MEEFANQSDQPPPIVCGQCGQTIEPAGTEPAQCPHCGAELFSPAEEELEPAEVDQTDDTSDEELSVLRIRQISALRRGADRARSYCLIGLVVLIVGAGQLVMITSHDVRTSGWHLMQCGYVAGAIAASFFAWRLGIRVTELTRELNQPLQNEPLEPPDFSTLNDGSQHARHLEEM